MHQFVMKDECAKTPDEIQEVLGFAPFMFLLGGKCILKSIKLQMKLSAEQFVFSGSERSEKPDEALCWPAADGSSVTTLKH